MSQQRDDMVALRNAFFERLEHMRRIGDYSAGAADIRETGEAIIKILDHILERMK